MGHAGALVPAVTIEGCVAGQQRDESIDVAVLAGGGKLLGQFGLFLARNFEARACRVRSGAGRCWLLAAVQKHGPFDG